MVTLSSGAAPEAALVSSEARKAAEADVTAKERSDVP